MTTADLIAVYRAHEHEIGSFAEDGSIEREGFLLFGMDADVIAGRLLALHAPAYALDLWHRLSPAHRGRLGELTPEKYAAVRDLLETVTAPSHA